MQSGRILPIMRQFFRPSEKSGAASGDRESPSQQYRQPERDASEEEAQKAATLLQQSEEFQKNGLKVAAGQHQGRHVLFVHDGTGTQLRMIHSPEIERILQAIGTPDSPRQGRILDRRI